MGVDEVRAEDPVIVAAEKGVRAVPLADTAISVRFANPALMEHSGEAIAHGQVREVTLVDPSDPTKGWKYVYG